MYNLYEWNYLLDTRFLAVFWFSIKFSLSEKYLSFYYGVTIDGSVFLCPASNF